MVVSGVAYWEIIIRLAIYFSVWITVLHKLLISIYQVMSVYIFVDVTLRELVIVFYPRLEYFIGCRLTLSVYLAYRLQLITVTNICCRLN